MAEHSHLPAWRRPTQGESRLPVSAAIVAMIALQAVIPARLALPPRLLLPGIEALLLVAINVADPGRVSKGSRVTRFAGIALVVLASLANASTAVRLVAGLARGQNTDDAIGLLLSGAAIWLTNVLVFALWYWELDRGGPVVRMMGEQPYPDLFFPQMGTPDLAPPDWEPAFADYLYTSFTNATAFSPTDTLPLTIWAKMTFLVQSLVSLGVVALVVARAVNVLK